MRNRSAIHCRVIQLNPMKTQSTWIFVLLLAALPGVAQDQRTTNPTDSTDRNWSVTPWQAKARGEHQTEWFSVRYSTNPATGRVRATTNTYVELGTSLNRRDAFGQW